MRRHGTSRGSEASLAGDFRASITSGIGSRRTERLWHRKARDDGRIVGPREGDEESVKLTRSRRDAAQAWCEIAKALASSEGVADRQLSQSIVNCARWLPGVRYKPPEQQAQRELEGMGRRRPMHTLAPGPQPQRAKPEPDRRR